MKDLKIPIPWQDGLRWQRCKGGDSIQRVVSIRGRKNASIQHGRVSFPKRLIFHLHDLWAARDNLSMTVLGKLLLEWSTNYSKNIIQDLVSDSWVWGKDGLFPKNLEIRCSSHIPTYPERASPWRSWPCWTVVGVDSLFVEHTED